MKSSKVTYWILLLVLISSCSSIKKNEYSQASAHISQSCAHSDTSFRCVEVVEVYDGDTIFINLPDQHPLFGKRMGVRIIGIDTPEIRTKNKCEKKKAQEAKKLLEAIISKASRVDIVKIQKDKFFRILGVVLVDGLPVSNELVKGKLAHHYYGEKKIKRNWCDDKRE